MNDPLEKPNPTQAEYFKDIVATIREPLLVLDGDLRVLAANRSFYKFFKAKAGETIGQLIYEMGNRQWDIPGLRLLLETILPQKAVFNEYNVEHDFPIIGKRILLLNARQISRPPNHAKWILLAFEDVTERRQLEHSLEASEERFRRAFETAHDGMLLIEKTGGKVVNSNQSAEDSLGYSKRSLQKKNLWELGILKDEQQFRQTALELENQGVVGLSDMLILTKRGGSFPADVILTNRASVIQCNIRDISAHKHVEETLEGKYRTIFENAMEGIFQSTPEGRFLTVNPAFARMLGYASPEEMIATITDIGRQVYVESPRRLEFMHLMAKQGSVSGFEFQMQRKDGGTIWVTENARAIRDPKGILLYFEGTTEDITQRKLAEEALRASEERYHELIQSANDIIYSIDLTGKFTSVNRATERITGYTEEESLRMNLAQITTPESFEVAREMLQRKLANHAPTIYPLEIIAKDGHKVFLELNARLAYQDGKVVGSQGIARDISERKRAEENLRISEEHFRTIVEQTNSVAYIVEKGRAAPVSYISPQIKQLLGFTAEEWISQPGLWESLLHPEDRERVLAENDRADREGTPFKSEYRIHTKDGRVIWLSDESKDVLDAQGKFLYLQGNERDITERKMQEEMLRKSEQRYRTLAEASSDIIFVIDSSDRVQYVNTFAARQFAMTPEQMIGRPRSTFFPPDISKQQGQFLQTVFIDGQPQTYDSLLRFGAREIWISSMLVPLRDESGVVTAVMGISRDITERKQAEEILTESEERYRSLFKNMLNGFAYCKMIFEKGLPQDFIYLEVNDAFSALTGLKEVEGKKVTEVIPGIRESDPVLFETYGRVALSGKPETLEIYVEAMNMWFSIAVYSPRKEYFVAVFDIITARKQAEQALRESEERFHSLYENSSIGIYRATPDGHITLANPALVRMLGYQTFEEISQRDLRTDGYEPEYSRLEFQQRIAREGGVNGLESALKLKDGSTIFVRENAHLVLDERDQPLFYEGTVEDITKRKRAEEEIRKLNATLEQRVEERTNELREAQEELVRKEKLATLGQLAGSVGHELRNPLGVINTSIYYLKMVQPDANEKIKKHLEMIENQVHLSDKIITDLLDFSRGATAEREQISVPSLLEKTLERFPVPAGVELRLDLPEDLPDVFADLRQMEQVLGNLVTNGCQAMKNAGRLTIYAHAVVPVSAAGPESSTGREQQKEMVAIAVNDTGTGIAPENMQKLFEPLFTTKARGIGLGLAVSKKLAEANGGRIEVESEVGKGSTFTLYLPVPWSL